MRLLIVNADDFGLNQSATDGIIESHLAGSVTSTTLMANAPDAERAATLAQAHPALGVGLHFNLTWGRPLSPVDAVPALVDANGEFWSRGVLGRRLLSRRVPAVQIRRELETQVSRLHALGVTPTHVDSHQHVHGFGRVFDQVAGYCTDAGIPMRVPWVERSEGAGMARHLRRSLLGMMLAGATGRWRGRVRWNDGLGSVFDLGAAGEELDGSHYLRILGQARGNVFELMVHPVTSAEAMDGFTRVGKVGEAEWRYLRSGRLAALAHEAGFVLGSYRDLPR